MQKFQLKLFLWVLTPSIIALFTTACFNSAAEPEAQDNAVYVPAVGEGSASYQLDWDQAGVTFDVETNSWSVETALGYTITIIDGELTNASLQLIDCNEIAADFSLIRTVSAGHGDELDPTFISGPFIDSLNEPAKLEAGTIFDLGASYCEGHYVVAGQNSTDLPSIFLTGSWVHNETGESGIIEVESSLAWGEVHELPNIIDFADGKDVEITVTRSLGTLFDAADFRTMSDSEINRAILRQLTGQAEFSMTGQ